ncbi:conserved hypothetical protein, partial [Ricinus communis]
LLAHHLHHVGEGVAGAQRTAEKVRRFGQLLLQLAQARAAYAHQQQPWQRRRASQHAGARQEWHGQHLGQQQACHHHQQRTAKELRHRPVHAGLQQQAVQQRQSRHAAQQAVQGRVAAVGPPLEDVDPFDAALAGGRHQPQALGDAPRRAAVRAGPPQPGAFQHQDHGREQQHGEG